MAEDRMSLLLQELEALKPQVLFAEAQEAITSGKAHYDAHTEAVTEAATLICSTWAAFIAACAAFVVQADEQIALLWSMPDASGQPAFDLPDGQVVLQRVIQAFPRQPPPGPQGPHGGGARQPEGPGLGGVRGARAGHAANARA
jgi:hypothetical protein